MSEHAGRRPRFTDRLVTRVSTRLREKVERIAYGREQLPSEFTREAIVEAVEKAEQAEKIATLATSPAPEPNADQGGEPV